METATSVQVDIVAREGRALLVDIVPDTMISRDKLGDIVHYGLIGPKLIEHTHTLCVRQGGDGFQLRCFPLYEEGNDRKQKEVEDNILWELKFQFRHYS